jgi:hypothetical protein
MRFAPFREGLLQALAQLGFNSFDAQGCGAYELRVPAPHFFCFEGTDVLPQVIFIKNLRPPENSTSVD